jgi:putative PIN family toxin of toxin-antitoxin system
LSSPNIQRKYAISDQDINELVTLLNQETILLSDLPEVSGAIPDDPKDEIFLACAIDGQADLIVSGDRHLLNLRDYHDIPILTARQFLEELDKE